jgi:hypothetical protein
MGVAAGHLTCCGQRSRVLPGLALSRATISPHSAAGSDMLDLRRAFGAVGACVTVIPALWQDVGSAVEFDDVQGVAVLGVRFSACAARQDCEADARAQRVPRAGPAGATDGHNIRTGQDAPGVRASSVRSRSVAEAGHSSF